MLLAWVAAEAQQPANPGPLSLEQAMRTALQMRPTMEAAQAGVDAARAAVARAAIAHGAVIVNDISAMRFDPKMAYVVAESGAYLVLMHMQGTPGNMQKNPQYQDVVGEIKEFLHKRLTWAEKNGLERQQLIIDPGIGFGKTLEHNLLILKHLDKFTELDVPLLLGHSRKAFIGAILEIDDPQKRDNGTAAISALAVTAGANIIRVHEVKATVQAVRLAAAIQQS